MNQETTKQNDCYKCKHRQRIPGSAHSACGLLQGREAIEVAMKMASGIIIQIQKEGVDLIEFDPVGIKGGWCLWPVDFDPTWVTCYLPVNELTESV